MSSKGSDIFPSDGDAIRAAREEVKNMFRSSEQLTRINPYLVECIRKKQTVEAQLSSAVRTQVDETRLGLQLLQEAATMMQNMRSNFLAIDQYCKDSKMVLRDSPEIHKVNTARKNLDATTRLLDKFRSLPVQAEEIIDELDENDHAIKSVYKSLRKLFHLRDSAMDQPTNGIPGGASGFSSDFLSQLDDNFAELTKSSEIIEERIWENIADCMFLSKEDPITLVRTLEVIELEDRAMRKVFGRAKKEEDPKASGKSGKGEREKEKEKDAAFMNSNALASMSSMREKCLNVLEKSIADLFNHLHIDEEQFQEQERVKKMEKKKKDAALAEYKKKLAKEKKALARRLAGDDEEEEEGDEVDDVEDVEDEEDVDEPREEIAVGGRLGQKGKGLYHNADDDEEEEGGKRDRDAPSDYILHILEEMTDLVENLPFVLQSLLPCFPPDYNLLEFFVERYIRWLKLTLSFHTNDISKLSKTAQLKTVNWIEWYRGELKSWENKFPSAKAIIQLAAGTMDPALAAQPSTVQSKKDKTRSKEMGWQYYDDLIRDLMQAYTKSTEETLIKLCDNILAADKNATAELDGEGQYVTSGPADLFYTINSTIEIVLSNFGLHAKPLSFVCLMLARVFQHYQNAQLEFLNQIDMEDDILFFGDERIEKTDTYFCALINNSTICREHMDDLKDKILDRLREAEGIEQATPLQLYKTNSGSGQQMQHKTLLEQMEDTFEECGEGFVAVASEAIDLLVLQITVTLQKPTANLFSPSWLKDSSVTDDIVLTLQDFMDDYKKWIGRDAYFSRILIKCLHSVIAEYLRKLTDVKPQVSTNLFERLKADKSILQKFFMQYTSAANAGGDDEDGAAVSSSSNGLIPIPLLKNELRLLTLVNKVVHEDVDFMSVHFDKLITRFGHNAKEVMEGLMAMRTDLTKAQRKEVMEKFCAKLPQADAAQLLEKQLVAQTVAAMSSPRTKRGQMDDEEVSTKSWWDRFKSKKENKKAAAQKKKPVNDDDGISFSEFTDK